MRDIIFALKTIPRIYRVYYAIYTLISILLSLIFAVMPLIVAKLIVNFSRESIIIYAILLIFSYTTMRLMSMANGYVSAYITALWREKVLNHIIHIEPKLFWEKGPSHYSAILSYDTDMMSDVYADFIYTIPGEIIATIVMVALLYKVPYAMYLSIAVLGIMWLEIILKKRITLPLYQQMAGANRNRREAIFFTVQNIKSLRHLKNESDLLNDINTHMEKWEKHTVEYGKKDLLIKLVRWIGEILKVTALAAAILYSPSKEYTAASVLIIDGLTNRFGTLISNLTYLKELTIHIQQIKHLLSLPTWQPKDTQVAQISIKYPIKLDITPPTKVLITGKTGSGKSTLVSSIVGRNESNETGGKYVVMDQHPYIFKGSIKDNISMVNPNLSDAEIEKILDTVCLPLPLEHSTEGLSEGERKRLALARIIASNAPIVILDEPFAGIDNQTKHAITDNIRAWLKDKGGLIISHDIETTKTLCNEVVNIDES